MSRRVVRSRGGSRGGPRASTGFALPMVVLLVLLATLMLSVVIQRATAQGYTIKRQRDAYLEHHASRGFQEVLNFYVQSLGRVPVAEILEEDGHVFDLHLRDRSVVSIYIRDAQGTLTTSLVGLNEQQQYLVLKPLSYLERLAPGRTDLVRPAGPLQVSARTASKEVLDAIEGALTDAEPSGTLAAAIIKARADGQLTAAELTAAGSEAGFTSGLRASDFRNLLTHEPTMFRAIVELRQPQYGGGMRLMARYSGLMQVQGSTGGQAAGTATGLVSASLFLSWGPLPIE